jgi:hypothetical protein
MHDNQYACFDIEAPARLSERACARGGRTMARWLALTIYNLHTISQS